MIVDLWILDRVLGEHISEHLLSVGVLELTDLASVQGILHGLDHMANSFPIDLPRGVDGLDRGLAVGVDDDRDLVQGLDAGVDLLDQSGKVDCVIRGLVCSSGLGSLCRLTHLRNLL